MDTDNPGVSKLPVLQFQPWQSSVDPTFWFELAQTKLEKQRLSEETIHIEGHYNAARHTEVGSPMHLGADSLLLSQEAPDDSRGLVAATPPPPPAAAAATSNLAASSLASAPGTLLNLNTLQSFKAQDRHALLAQAGCELWECITSGRAEQRPELLNTFMVVTFADLKRFAFLHWFCFPAFVLPQPVRLGHPGVQPLDRHRHHPAEGGGLTQEELKGVIRACDRWQQGGGAESAGGGTGAPSAWLLQLGGEEDTLAAPLTDWARLSSAQDTQEGKTDGGNGEVILAFLDPCPLPGHPGWALRNLALMACVRWRVKTLRVIAVRQDRQGNMDPHTSLLIPLQLPSDLNPHSAPEKLCGWELNARGKAGPRCADLGPSMDPLQVASQAVDLNLKLMRWRMLPQLDTAKLNDTSCLLLGAGTLGCAVARTLMGWGVRRIRLVDCGRVSFSNPVRQSLFTFQDCLQGGRPKAEAAAERLKEIFPGMDAEGETLSIPMPGHSVTAGQEETAVLAQIQRLHQLVSESDVVFMLTDTRESRWLPSLLCTATPAATPAGEKNSQVACKKVVINAALGFDSFLVMRHGTLPSHSHEGGGAASEGGGAAAEGDATPHLGCYFCMDVVGPSNSTEDRTLDQQCTVTRPGLAPIASALAVELAVALLHHPLGAGALAPDHKEDHEEEEEEEEVGSPLGVVPHQIRGSVSDFRQTHFSGPAFTQCIACSPRVRERWAEEGAQFVLKVCNEPKYLEELTGLSEMHAEFNEDDWDVEEDDEDDLLLE